MKVCLGIARLLFLQLLLLIIGSTGQRVSSSNAFVSSPLSESRDASLAQLRRHQAFARALLMLSRTSPGKPQQRCCSISPRPVSCCSMSENMLQLSHYPISSNTTVSIYTGDKLFDRQVEKTGDSIWAASVALKNWLRKPANRWLFESKSVLELGAGTGFLGISLAKLGASVVLTDLEQQIHLLQKNIEVNEPYPKPAGAISAVLPWGSPVDSALNPESDIDLVIASDPLVSSGVIEPLAETIVSILQQPRPASVKNSGRVAILALTRHRAFASVPDYAHNLVHDRLVAHHGLHALQVDSLDSPKKRLGESYFQGAALQEGAMPIDVFAVTADSELLYKIAFNARDVEE